MLTRVLKFLVLGLALVGSPSCSGSDHPWDPDSLNAVREGVVGGHSDTTNTAVVGLTIMNRDGTAPEGRCTATVIYIEAPSALLLTAAHCAVEHDDSTGDVAMPIVKLDPSRFRITPGANMLSDIALARFYRVVGATVAPDYDGYTGNPSDVAVLRIVGVSDAMPRMPVLKPAQDHIKAGTDITLVGYGVTGSAAQDDSGFRRSTTQVISWENAQFIGVDQMNGHGICEGDSGGPVVAMVDGKPVVAAGPSKYAAPA